MSDGLSGDIPLSGERTSGLRKGRPCGCGGESGESHEKKLLDDAGSKDLKIKGGFASMVADDLLRAGAVGGDKGSVAGTVDRILLTASGATHGMAEPCCSFLSKGCDTLAAEVVSGCTVATPSCMNLSVEGDPD